MTATIYGPEGELLGSNPVAEKQAAPEPLRLARYLGYVVVTVLHRHPDWEVRIRRVMGSHPAIEISRFDTPAMLRLTRIVDENDVERVRMEPEQYAEMLVDSMVRELELTEPA